MKALAFLLSVIGCLLSFSASSGTTAGCGGEQTVGATQRQSYTAIRHALASARKADESLVLDFTLAPKKVARIEKRDPLFLQSILRGSEDNDTFLRKVYLTPEEEDEFAGYFVAGWWDTFWYFTSQNGWDRETEEAIRRLRCRNTCYEVAGSDMADCATWGVFQSICVYLAQRELDSCLRGCS